MNAALQTAAVTIGDVESSVCAYFGLTVQQLRSASRARAVTFPRMLAIYVCREQLRSSYSELGQHFGDRDHTTAMSACRRIEAMLADGDEQARHCVAGIIGRISRFRAAMLSEESATVSPPRDGPADSPAPTAHDAPPRVAVGAGLQSYDCTRMFFTAERCGVCDLRGGTDEHCGACEGTGYVVRAGAGESLPRGKVADALRAIVREDARLKDPEIPEWLRERLMLLARFAERDHDIAEREAERRAD